MNSTIDCNDMPKLADIFHQQKNIVWAEVLGCDDSRVSRIKSGDAGLKLIEIDKLLTESGMKVVPADHLVISFDELLMLKKTACRALQHDIQGIEDLKAELESARKAAQRG